MPIDAPGFAPKLSEIGRIRLGEKTEKGMPTKLEHFRLTSPHKGFLEAAKLYGGAVQPWCDPNANPSKQTELKTESDSLEVVIPQNIDFEQWFEAWSAGGCTHRCNGYFDTITQAACTWGCGERDESPEEQERAQTARKQRGVKPTTRFSVLLSGVPGLGVWRLETHGYYAARELAGVIQQVQMLGMTAATLILAQRVSKKDKQTNRYAVPTIALPHTPEQVMVAIEAAGQATQALQAAERVAIKGARSAHIHEPNTVDPNDPFNLDPAINEQVDQIQQLAQDLGLSDAQLRNALGRDGLSLDNLSTGDAAGIIARMGKKLSEKRAAA